MPYWIKYAAGNDAAAPGLNDTEWLELEAAGDGGAKLKNIWGRFMLGGAANTRWTGVIGFVRLPRGVTHTERGSLGYAPKPRDLLASKPVVLIGAGPVLFETFLKGLDLGRDEKLWATVTGTGTSGTKPGYGWSVKFAEDDQ